MRKVAIATNGLGRLATAFPSTPSSLILRCPHEARASKAHPPRLPTSPTRARPAERVAALEDVAARYAVAITPAMAELIDPADAHDPIARQFVPDAAELDPRPEERADPIGDDVHEVVAGPGPPLPRPRAPEAGLGLRRLLPLLLPPRDGRAGRGAHCRPTALAAALAYIRAIPRSGR